MATRPILVRDVPHGSRRVLWLALVLHVLMGVALGIAFRDVWPATFMVPFAGIYGWLLHRHYRDRRPAVVDERGLSIGGWLRQRTKHIKSVELLAPNESRDQWRVRLLSRFDMPFNVDCSSEEDARALVEALRFAPSQRVGVYAAFRGTALTYWIWCLAPMLAWLSAMFLGCSAHVALGVGAGAMAAMVIALRAVRTEIAVGLDGVRVGRHFIPFEALAIEANGKRLRIGKRGEPLMSFYAPMGSEALELRVNEARKAVKASASTLAGGASEDYRSPAYPKDVLLRVAEDVAQSSDTRGVAVSMLRVKELDEQDRDRLRIAAQTTAAIELREELEALTHSDSGSTRRRRAL